MMIIDNKNVFSGSEIMEYSNVGQHWALLLKPLVGEHSPAPSTSHEPFVQN